MNDYEKKYKEALARAREIHFSKDEMEYIFPELRESDDEKIRKVLIDYFKRYKEQEECGIKTFYGIPADDILAWLEKQGEQKHTDKIESKFKVGDVMRSLEEAKEGITDGLPVVVSIDEEYYHCNNELISIKDQDKYEYPPMNRKQKPAWSEEDEKTLNRIIYCIEHCQDEEIEARYNGNRNVNPKRYEQISDWLKSLKGRVQPQNKWKESLATADLENSLCDIQDGFSDTSYEYRTLGEAIEFIRCTESKPQWKPSDAQMIALNDVITNGHLSNTNERILKGLQEQLKKLKGE